MLALRYLGIGLLTLGFYGCSQSEPTHPVKGRLHLERGDIGQLSGHVIEAVLDSDPLVRASGEIQPDGSFSLETLHHGAIRKGALEGKYTVRLVLSDDDGRRRKAAAVLIEPNYLAFERSGLSFEVPAAETVYLTLKPRR